MKFKMLYKDTSETQIALRRCIDSDFYYPGIALINVENVEIIRGQKHAKFLEANCESSIVAYLRYRLFHGKNNTVITGW